MAKAPSPDLSGVSVLIVEDDFDSGEVLRQMVASFKASVLVARDGEEAKDVVSQRAPDLVLCDLVMPRSNGFQFVDWLRRQPQVSRTPVIAVTALGTMVDFERTCAAGFTGHLVKPIDYQTIQAQLQRVFSPRA
jgi:CheY-like chemotaxis protein